MDSLITVEAQRFARILLKTQDTMFNSVRVYNDLYIKITTRAGKISRDGVNSEVNALKDSLNTIYRTLNKIESKIDELHPSNLRECLTIHCYTTLTMVIGYIYTGIPALRRLVNIAFGQAPGESTRLDMKIYLNDLKSLPDSPEVDYSGVYMCKNMGVLYLNVVYEQDIMNSEEPTEDGF